MCVDIEVIFPTIETFLFLFSLRSGSILILFWTIFRTIFCIIFFATAILEVLIHVNYIFGAWLVTTDYKTPENVKLILFYCYLTLLICDSILLTFTCFLGYGLYWERSYLLKYYLICRFITWIVEVLTLSVLCLSHKLLIGYYLSILLFVILEFYSFIVVYSYFVYVLEVESELECKMSCNVQE